MTAVMIETDKSGAAALESLRVRVADLKQATERLAQTLVNSRQRRDNLIAERGPLVLPARSQKDSRAQKRLNAIDEQLIPLKRDIPDDEAALAELSGQLVLAENDVERAEWELQRAAVRRMIEGRLEGKTIAAIEKAVNALSDTLTAAKAEDEAIETAMLKFEHRLARETRPLRMAAFERARLAAWKLKDELPVDSREFGYNQALKDKEFAESDHRNYSELLQVLDRLELVF